MAGAQVQPPGPHRCADFVQGILADRRQEIAEALPLPVSRPALTESEPKKGERRVLIRAWAVAILAVYDLRLVRVQSQPDLGHPVSDRLPHVPRLTFALAVHHGVVRVAFKRHRREFPGHPRIERIVGSPRGFSPRGSHGTERDSLPSFRSLHPLHRYARIHSQWANSSGSLSVTPRHQALNRFQVRSRLYFFRAQRIT